MDEFINKVRRFFNKKKDKYKRLKILILADQSNWVINRNINQIIQGVPCDFEKRFYSQISSNELLKISNEFDLVHYGNFDFTFHKDIIDKFEVPFLVSIRSHRYLDFVPDLKKIIKRNKFYCHVINKELQKEFAGSRYIPNGIMPMFKPKKEFIVGFVGVKDEYKGFDLIEQACKDLRVKFHPAIGNIPYNKMPDYYDSINLLVSASINEGHCNPVYEAISMNIPVISTDTSTAKSLNITKVARNVNSIKNAISKFYAKPQIKEFTWQNANREMTKFYYDILIAEAKKKKPLSEITDLKNAKEYFIANYF